MSTYQDIAGGYSYAALRVGLIIRNPQGREVYCQPGDDTGTMLRIIEVLDEVAADAGKAILTDMALGVYFS